MPEPPGDCRHKAKRVYRDPRNPDISRATCSYCGCSLIRTQISWHWSFTGELGASTHPPL